MGYAVAVAPYVSELPDLLSILEARNLLFVFYQLRSVTEAW